MKFITSKQFDKSFSKLPKKIKDKSLKQFELFIFDPADVRLNNHSLNGKWSKYRSINITGDIRAIYKFVDQNVARFVEIGSHSELYE
ncbi:MAG: addiction module RelE/StbE family toxin [Candidatus Paceibacteria bacterium]|jgi:addiction module RelE/StbE family toxin